MIKGFLEEITKSQAQSVHIPNGTYVPVKGLGNSRLPNGLELDNVLHIPDFKCHLIYVSKLTQKHNCAITFSANSCYIQDLHLKKVIGKSRQQNGLYVI